VRDDTADPGRFHLTLTADGRRVAQGWWGSEATARDKFTEWVGSGVPDARVTLVDEETGAVLTSWSDEARPGVVGGAP
jgi:hypothetical protein